MVLTCIGCNGSIKDKFFMKVNGRPWHPICLQCTACKNTLSETCFQRNGKLYCKSDFFKFFGIKCAGCGLGIFPHDLVRKSRTDRIYHVTCFVCSVCRREVATGEELFILENDKVLCKDDFFSQNTRGTKNTKKPHKTFILNEISKSLENNTDMVLNHSFDKEEINEIQELEEDECQRCQPPLIHTKQDEFDENCDIMQASTIFDNCRHSAFLPRSLKNHINEQSDNESIAESISSSNSFSSSKETKRNESKLVESVTNTIFAPGAQVTISLMNNNMPSGAGAKRRGPRTTIKAKQLETLKTAFAATPKPTRHIREQLARDTGLNMRVIQVWFQNRRSKERRMKQMSVFGPVRRHQFLRSPRRVRSILMSSTSHMRDLSSDREMVMTGYFRSGIYSHFPISPQHPQGELFGADCQLITSSLPMDATEMLSGDLRQCSNSGDDLFPHCFQSCI